MESTLLARAGAYVVIRGSSTLVPLMQAVGAAYMAENPSIGLPLVGGGSERGYRALLNGSTDIGMVSGPMPEGMLVWARRQPVKMRISTVAVDGIAAIVHPSNPVTGLSLAQLTDIFEGAITNWSDVGGPNAPISVYSQNPSEGTYGAWLSTVAVRSGLLTPRADVVEADLIDARVGTDRWGIGYDSPLLLDADRVRVLAIDGSLPTAEEVRGGRYPIRRNLDLVTSAAPTRAVADVLAYCLAPDKGQRIMAGLGVVPVRGA